MAEQPRTIGRYELREELGAGGFATVYRAYDPVLDRDLAVKILHRHLATQSDVRQRFVGEGRALADLRHLHVVDIYDAGETEGTAYLAMQLVEGRALDVILAERGPLPLDEVLKLATQVADALAAIHAIGLVHRDVKPSNIICEAGTGNAILLDLGIARSMETPGLTTAGSILGTLSYMAPEQMLEGGQVTPRTDVYQLAATLYNLLAGQPPFRGEMTKVLQAVVREPPPDLATLRPDLPAAVVRTIGQAMAKDPAVRPSGTRELADQLRSAAEATPVQTTSPGPAAEDATRMVDRSAVAAAAAAAGAGPAPPATTPPPPPPPRGAPAAAAAATADPAPETPPADTPPAAARPAAPAAAESRQRRNMTPLIATGGGALLLLGGLFMLGRGSPPDPPLTPRPAAIAPATATVAGAQETATPAVAVASPTVVASPTATTVPAIVASPSPVGKPTVTVAGSPVVKPEGAGTVLLEDNFDSPSAGRLPSTSGDPSAYLRGYAGGEYFIRFVVPRRDFEVRAELPGRYGDASIAIDARVVDDPTDKYLLVACRDQGDNRSNYQFVVVPGAGEARLYRFDNDRGTMLVESQPSAAIRRGTQANRLELVCDGSTITARINGTQFASIQDPTYAGGEMWIAVGVFSDARAPRAAEARFNNLVVTQQ